MFANELDSFIRKFHQLWRAGQTAHLDIDTHAGQAWVGLRVQLGHVPGPPYQHVPPPSRRRSPAYQRRQERRRRSACDRSEAMATTTEIVVGDQPSDESVAKIDELEADEAPTVQVEADSKSTSAAEADCFDCELCEFKSKWKNGLSIHMSRKHDKIEQLDGTNDALNDHDQGEDEYEGSKHYWKSGWLGAAFQSYLDALKVLEESDLELNDREVEKEKILKARKEALGSNYLYYPPWKP